MSKIKVDIRTLEYENAERYIEILNQLSDCTRSSPYQTALFLDYHKKNYSNFKYYGAFYNNQLVGIASTILENKIAYGHSQCLHVEDVVVDAEYKSMGVGKALLEFIKDKAKSLGVRKIILNCDEDKIQFYEKVGFFVDGYCMRLNIE